MKKIFGLVQASPLGVLKAENIAVGVVASLFSLFIGFYYAAFILADKYYPAMALDSVKALHRELFGHLAAAAALHVLAVLALFWFFSKGYVERLLKECRGGREGN